MKKYMELVVALILTGGVVPGIDAASNIYQLEGVEVNADREYDTFGNVITEQSYYRTGGDVNVITSEDLAERNYSDITSAVKNLPGVQVNGIGYHGGEYGAGTQYNTTVTINGDDRVVILLDGRRVDNSVSGVMSAETSNHTNALANLDQVTSIDNIESIEVIKGPGASVYGADATGGVINIITKKGALKPQGTVNLSTGSWGHHVYRANFSGTNKDGSLRYFLSAMRDMGGDTEYYDKMTGKNYRFNGSKFKEEGVNVRIDKIFNETHKLTVSYNHTNSIDGYPITVPYYQYMNPEDWKRIKDTIAKKIYGDISVPGYRNDWYINGFKGNYNAHNNNDLDITYSFAKDHEMESFVRFYDQSHQYWTVWGPSDELAGWNKPIPTPWDPEWNDYVQARMVRKDSARSKNNDYNRGVQFQLGKSFGTHDILTGWTVDRARHESFSTSEITNLPITNNVRQTTIDGYLQDKIHISDKFEIAPSLRFQHTDAISKSLESGRTSNSASEDSIITGALSAQYLFSKGFSMFAGWTQVNRPLAPSDYDPSTLLYEDQQLKNEKGNVYTIGVRKSFSDKTSLFANYDYTDMSNAISRQSVWDNKVGDWATKAVNAKQTRHAFNIGINQKLDQHWNLQFNYSTVDEKWTAKQGMKFQPGLGIDSMLINAYINSTRPKNKCVADLSYTNGKLFSSLTTTIYSGMDTKYFTDNQFIILDWGLNYDINQETTVYANVYNLTNEGYEVKFHPYVGKGAYAMPGRSFMLGVKYKF